MSLRHARFCWLRLIFSVKRACVARRGNSLERLRLNAYSVDNNRKLLLVHRAIGKVLLPTTVVGWSFYSAARCRHLFKDHGDNRVSLLLCERPQEHRGKRARRAHA